MNLPTLIVLLLVAAAVVLALWLPRRHGRKPTACGCSSSASDSCATTCQGCPLVLRCKTNR